MPSTSSRSPSVDPGGTVGPGTAAADQREDAKADRTRAKYRTWARRHASSAADISSACHSGAATHVDNVATPLVRDGSAREDRGLRVPRRAQRRRFDDERLVARPFDRANVFSTADLTRELVYGDGRPAAPPAREAGWSVEEAKSLASDLRERERAARAGAAERDDVRS